jgi:DNA-binding NarL/FixJ family response regulator
MPWASATDSKPHAPGETPREGRAETPVRVLVLGGEPCDHARRRATIAAAAGLGLYEADCAALGGSTPRGPDVVLIQLDPRAPDGEHRLREAREVWKPAPVLVVSESADLEANRDLVRKGARGVIGKDREREQLVTAIRKVTEGEIWLSRGCLSRIVDKMASSTSGLPHLRPARQLAKLTEREHEVVALIAEGLHNRAIAKKLGIADNTVRHHLTAIFAKLGVADRLELAVYALRHRIAASGRRTAAPRRRA